MTDFSGKAVDADTDVELTSPPAEPNGDMRSAGAYQRDDGLWVPQGARPRPVGSGHASTYDHAEPGILFLDRMNKDNNLTTARPSRPPTPAPNSRCRPMAAAAWVRST